MSFSLAERPVVDRTDMATTFGEWVRESRKAAKFTQKDLGELVALTTAQVSRIESGEQGTRPQIVRLIATATGANLDDGLRLLSSRGVASASITRARDPAADLPQDEAEVVRSYRGIHSEPAREVIRNMIRAQAEAERRASVGGGGSSTEAEPAQPGHGMRILFGQTPEMEGRPASDFYSEETLSDTERLLADRSDEESRAKKR